MMKFFKKSKNLPKSKNPKSKGHFGPFCPNLGKNDFPWKKKRAVSVFKYSNYLPLCKKLEHPIAEKSNELTDTQVCRQTTVIL